VEGFDINKVLGLAEKNQEEWIHRFLRGSSKFCIR